MTTTEPTTRAGRELLAVICGMDPQGLYPPDPRELVLAIEAEALPTVEELAVAMNSAQIAPEEIRLGHDLTIPASRILAALKEARKPCLECGTPGCLQPCCPGCGSHADHDWSHRNG